MSTTEAAGDPSPEPAQTSAAREDGAPEAPWRAGIGWLRRLTAAASVRHRKLGWTLPRALLRLTKLPVGWLVLAFLLTWLLGTLGFRLAPPPGALPGQLTPWSDACYRSLLLFDKESVAEGPVNSLLHLARFAAWLLAAGVLLKVVSELFQEQLHRWLAGRCQRHTIVCGLGWRGEALAESLRDLGPPVVALDLQPIAETSVALEVVGLQGDATDAEVLKRAGIGRAKYLFVMAGDDSTNADVAAAAAAAVEQVGRPVSDGGAVPLDCRIHISGSVLWRHLLGGSPPELAGGLVRCTFFNLPQRAAELVLTEHPIYRPLDYAPPTGQRLAPRLLLGGDGELAECLATEIAACWQARRQSLARFSASRESADPQGRTAQLERLPLTICGEQAARMVPAWCAAHPALAEACELEVLSPADLVARAERPRPAEPPYTTAYLAGEDDALTMSMVLLTERLLVPPEAATDWPIRPPIVACVAAEAGLCKLIAASRGRCGAGGDHATALFQPALHVFEVRRRTCHAGLISSDSEDRIAQQYYLRYNGFQPIVPWHELRPGETDRESSLRLARFVPVRLGYLGYGLEEFGPGDKPSDDLQPGQLELLAEMEHLRWMSERLAYQGWELAEHELPNQAYQDEAAGLTRILVPWRALPERFRAQNRDEARQLEVQLHEAGLRIRRLTPDQRLLGSRPAWLCREWYTP